jgi:hypothetical protein
LNKEQWSAEAVLPDSGVEDYTIMENYNKEHWWAEGVVPLILLSLALHSWDALRRITNKRFICIHYSLKQMLQKSRLLSKLFWPLSLCGGSAED